MGTSFLAADRWLESMLGWQPTNTSATRDQQKSEQDTIVARCRDAWRNQLLGKAIIGRLTMSVVGSGLVLKPQLKDRALGIQISNNFEKFVKKAEYEDTINFYSIQRLVFVSMLMAGDVFVNTVIDNNNNLKLQVIESDRVNNQNMSPDTKELIQGVYLKDNVPYAYSVQVSHPGDVYVDYAWQIHNKYGSSSNQQRFFHIWEKDRPGQVRGIPILTVVLENLRKLDRYIDAAMVDAAISSLFSVFIKSQSGISLPGTTESTENAIDSTPNKDQLYLKPGMVLNLDPGEDVVFGNPGRPNPNFDNFVTAILKLVAAAVNIPLDVLMMQYNSSYSASRAALSQYWKTVMYYRWMLIEKFCQPIYELWLLNEVNENRLPNEVLNYANNAVWVGPTKGSIDDTKEVVAAKERINIGISDIETEAEEISNKDWFQVYQQRSYEHKKRVESGLEPSIQEDTKIATPITTQPENDLVVDGE